MAGGISISYNPGERARREKQEELERRNRRQEVILNYLPRLTEQYKPEEVSAIARNFIEGNGLNLPTMRSRLLPPEHGVDVPTRSVQEPLKYIEPSTTVYNKDTGETRIIPGKNAKVYGNNESDVDVNIVDPETGEMKNVGRAKKDSKFVVKPKPGGGKGPKTAKEYQDDVAKEVLKNYFTLQATGQDTSKIEASAISAAKRFGMSIEQITNEPGLWGKLFGGEGTTEEKPSFTQPGTRATASPKPEKEAKYASAQDVKAAYKKGTLTKEQAAAILQRDFGMK